MGIILYRNMLNQEMKTFGKFLKQIYEDCIKKDIHLKYVYSSHVQKYIDEIKQGDTIIIVAHGSEEAIFHRYDHTNSVENHQYLLKSNELDVLNDNKIIAVSCGCARKLG
ncbi:hypothetical protein GZ789_002317, partial [Enterococcus faecalis]|nr:hypothetical protein [Enterococcus faecalis]